MPCWIKGIAAATRIGSGNEHEAARVFDMRIRARDHDLASFYGLAQGFQNLAREFWKLIHEQNTVMREGHFARFCTAAAPNYCWHRRCVMRFAKRAYAGNTPFIKQARKRMDHGCLQRLHRAERWQKPRQTRSKHGFSRTGCSDQQDVMTPGGCDFERTFGALLSFNIS